MVRGLALATIGWDLNSFLHELHSLPTLSRLVGDVTRHRWGRGLTFGAWVALGAYLAAGWRRPHAPPEVGASRDHAAAPAPEPGGSTGTGTGQGVET